MTSLAVSSDTVVDEPVVDDAGGRNPKWHARFETIVDTSAEVIARRGYHATGIAELCEANGLGKGALYHYIGSKEDLLVAIHDRIMNVVLQGADRVATEGGDARHRLVRLGEELLDVIGRYPHHVAVTLHEFGALTGEHAAHSRQLRRRYEEQIERVIADGIASGEFRPVDPRLTALAWLGMFNYTYRWLSGNGALSASQVAAAFTDLVLAGLLPR